MDSSRHSKVKQIATTLERLRLVRPDDTRGSRVRSRAGKRYTENDLQPDH